MPAEEPERGLERPRQRRHDHDLDRRLGERRTRLPHLLVPGLAQRRVEVQRVDRPRAPRA